PEGVAPGEAGIEAFDCSRLGAAIAGFREDLPRPPLLHAQHNPGRAWRGSRGRLGRGDPERMAVDPCQIGLQLGAVEGLARPLADGVAIEMGGEMLRSL